MAVVSIRETYDALRAAGFDVIPAAVMVAIAKAESGLNTSTVGDNGQSYGLFQIYQPVWGHKFNAQCASDLYCSANAAYEISNHGTNFNPWTVYRVVHDPEFAARYPELAANKYTNFLPQVASALGIDLSSFGDAIPVGFVDLAKCFINPLNTASCIAGKLGIDASKITVDIIKECGTDASCYINRTADAVTPDIPGVDDFFDAFMKFLPIENVKKGIVVLMLLGIGFTFVAIGAFGLARGPVTVVKQTTHKVASAIPEPRAQAIAAATR